MTRLLPVAKKDVLVGTVAVLDTPRRRSVNSGSVNTVQRASDFSGVSRLSMTTSDGASRRRLKIRFRSSVGSMTWGIK